MHVSNHKLKFTLGNNFNLLLSLNTQLVIYNPCGNGSIIPSFGQQGSPSDALEGLY